MDGLSLILQGLNAQGVRAVVADVADGSTDAEVIGVLCEEQLSGLEVDDILLDRADIQILAALVRPHLASMAA